MICSATQRAVTGRHSAMGGVGYMGIHDKLSQGFLSLSHLHLQNQFAALNVPKKDDSQIEGPSIANSYGFKVSMQNLQEAKALHEVRLRRRNL